MTLPKNFIVIGVSRGLGAALVSELLNNENFQVFGVSRTATENIKEFADWQRTGRFKYFQADISNKNEAFSLSDIYNSIAGEPVCIIFNAACLQPDVEEDGTIDFAKFNNVKNTGIDGLVNTLEVFQNMLLQNGGTFVGISSFGTLSAAICPEMISYAPTKSFLETLLRNIGFAWRNKNIQTMTVNLGFMREKISNPLAKLLFPTYNKVAKKIVKTVCSKKIPKKLNHTLFYSFIYHFFALMPEIVYYWVFHVALKRLTSFIKKSEI